LAANPDPATIPEESVAHIAVSLAAEQKEKEKRRLNIIVHNVEESEATDSAIRKNHDISKCLDIFKT